MGQTAVSRGVARALTATFMLALCGVATLEVVRDGRAGPGSPWSNLATAPARAWQVLRTQGLLAASQTLHGAMQSFEDALEERSTVSAHTLPPVQLALTRWLRTGNEQVVVGRSGWLYFRPALDYLTGRGFLDPQGSPRPDAGPASYPSGPLPALADFAAQLAERGIGLVVVPTPVKAALHPEGLARGLDPARLPLENASFDDFVARLQALEIPVYAPSARLARRRPDSEQFLRTDTHWTPQAMEESAAGLAEFLAQRPLPEGRGVAYARQAVGIVGRGDLAALLTAPGARPLFRPELALTRRVLTPQGEPWRPDGTADILLLGDSFTNIYSQAELGWGDSAGFAEQLSYFLGRPLDRVAVNAGGPSAVRERLAARLAAGDDRLEGKRLVIYQVSARELSDGGWRRVPLSASMHGSARRPEQPLPAKGFVVWESNRSGEWRIWTRRLEGSAARQLTPDEPGRQHCCPHLSPDGSQLAYLSRELAGDEYADDTAGELRLVRLEDGDTRVPVTSARPYGWGHRAVVWRSERELVYIGADGRTFLLESASGRSSPLTDEPRPGLAWLLDASLRHAVDGSPSFSAHDAATRRIVAGQRRSGCEPYFTHDGRFGFWVEGAGGPIRSLDLDSGVLGTVLDKQDRRIPGAQRYAYFPMVSRDGRLLAFGASAGDHDHFRSNYDIFVAPLDPGSLELLGRPLRLSAHPATDRYPDVHLESLDLQRWKREAPPAPTTAAAPPTAGPAAQSLETEATLRVCSRAPQLREISPYRSALMVCEWQVSASSAGPHIGSRLRVAHWALREGAREPIASAAPGFAARLRLVPLVGTPEVEGYPVFDTLPVEPTLPLHYSP